MSKREHVSRCKFSRAVLSRSVSYQPARGIRHFTTSFSFSEPTPDIQPCSPYSSTPISEALTLAPSLLQGSRHPHHVSLIIAQSASASVLIGPNQFFHLCYYFSSSSQTLSSSPSSSPSPPFPSPPPSFQPPPPTTTPSVCNERQTGR